LILLETTSRGCGGGRLLALTVAGAAERRHKAQQGGPPGSVSSSRRHSTDRQWLYRFPHLSAATAPGDQPTIGADF